MASRHVVGERFEWCAADREVAGQVRDKCSGVGPARDVIQHVIHSIEEPQAEAGVLLFVPACGVTQLDLRLVAERDARGVSPASSSRRRSGRERSTTPRWTRGT